jgi:hypothetical protein
MKNVKLYQFVIFFIPTEKEEEEGLSTKILVDVTNVLACSDQEVLIKASRTIPEEYLTKLSQVNIVVRPF